MYICVMYEWGLNFIYVQSLGGQRKLQLKEKKYQTNKWMDSLEVEWESNNKC